MLLKFAFTKALSDNYDLTTKFYIRVKEHGEIPGRKKAEVPKPVFSTKQQQINNIPGKEGKPAGRSSFSSQKQSTVIPANEDRINSVPELFQNDNYLESANKKSFEYRAPDLKEDTSRNTFYKENLIRLFFKKDEFIYVRSNDIVMIESCDHLVKVYVCYDDKIKKTIRCNTLKDFLCHLPEDHFFRIGRFCAINLKRLSGGNYNQQTFEFDFKISIKLAHPISRAYFNTIGK